MAPPLSREDYTVGWVCALPVELAAAQEMLDEEHPDLEHDANDNDENLYALGSICGHNVAIVCLPAGRIGNNPASSVAMQMRATFKKIRFGLMVGIGGGVPNASGDPDVRLGDVVVSQPSGKFSGVVQYDAGKTTPSGFERTGALNSPPQMLLAAVAKVRANELRGRSKMNEHIKKLETISKFQRSKAGPDILFEAAYAHEGGQTCDKCSSDRHEAREARDSEAEVVVHYGTIASGNQVIKDSTTRDKLSAELGGVLCFEMEAAGLMNSFPCLAVRGICDYADSHKNKRWQTYAAGTAAAYAREILSVIPPAEVAKSFTAEETMRNASAKSTYYIPFLKNKRFVGRHDELDKLHQRLLVKQDCRKITVIGLGGTGKTQVALQFAYTVKEAQPERSIFWMPAVSMESFEQACVEIAKALRISQAEMKDEDPKRLVKRRLSSSRAGQWLLVVDNADDSDIFFGTRQLQGIADYIPESKDGIILYTTRTPEMTDLTPGDVVELGEMSRQDARDFLTRSLVSKDVLRNDSTSTNLLDELLDELTCLPLAITQAAAYLNKNRMSISKYLQLLRNTEQDLVHLMTKEFRDDTRYKGSANAIATTWVVSFSQIRKHDEVAADLLEFMSCIEWKAIPRSLLRKKGSKARLEEAIGTLCGYSFLVRRSDDGSEAKQMYIGKGDIVEKEWFDIHRLVHLATRIWIQEYGDPDEVMDHAIQHVRKVFPSSDHANRYRWRAYMPHALRLLSTDQDCDMREKSELIYWVGRCLETDGRTREAMAWLEECCSLRSILGKDDPDLLSAQHSLAGVYRGDGQIKKAIELLEVVLKADETREANDSARLASQYALAGAYLVGGQVEKAVELLEAVVEKQKKVLDKGHPSLLISQQALGRAYIEDGQIEDAVELLEAVHELARGYLRDGQAEIAVELLEAVVETRNKVLYKGHTDQLASQHELARAYYAYEQVEKAIELLESVVEIEARILQPNDPSRLESVSVLDFYRAELAADTTETSSNWLHGTEHLNAYHTGYGRVNTQLDLLSATTNRMSRTMAEQSYEPQRRRAHTSPQTRNKPTNKESRHHNFPPEPQLAEPNAPSALNPVLQVPAQTPTTSPHILHCIRPQARPQTPHHNPQSEEPKTQRTTQPRAKRHTRQQCACICPTITPAASPGPPINNSSTSPTSPLHHQLPSS
ncbi:hypothetical protein OPT61_g9512 [Boeremia exigua]|uniref:Uncharacterized protein n=1 Tax=Boeremia exigua TaxID=749465 RepID=A0ACC2HTS3_9PLEO|nr:hypothetical protein OPT61_g9512 [Boeremia exigua]